MEKAMGLSYNVAQEINHDERMKWCVPASMGARKKKRPPCWELWD